MKTFAAFFLFFTVLFVLGQALRNDLAPRMPDDAVVLICGLLSLALLWIWQRRLAAPTTSHPPPTLEDLEREIAATPALVWHMPEGTSPPRRQRSHPNPGCDPSPKPNLNPDRGVHPAAPSGLRPDQAGGPAATPRAGQTAPKM